LSLGGRNRRAQTWIRIDIAAAQTGGDADFLDQLGEDLATLGITRRFFCALLNSIWNDRT